MTNVSARKVTSKEYQQAYEELVNLVASLQKKNAGFLINELLTAAEQVMIVKRFAAVFMFNNYYTPYRVSNTISMSLSTAQRLYEQFEEDKFTNLLNSIPPKEQNRFLSFFEDLIAAQVSPRARARLADRAHRR